VNAPDLIDVLDGFASTLIERGSAHRALVVEYGRVARLEVENAKLKGQLKAIRQWAKVPKATAKKGKATA
jgi:hypothetical protein